MGRRRVVRGAIALSFALLAPVVAAAQTCGGVALEGGTVRAVPDARTITLEDGRGILLDGIEVPGSQASALAAAALRAKLAGQPVRLSATSASPDRHGRIRAFVFTGAGLEPSVQHDMVRQGFARVAVRGAGSACVTELFAREREARSAGRGLWGDPDYIVRRADDPASILAVRGRMALVEGQVLSVRESGGTIYVNFGRRWSQDFTVTIAKRSEKAFSAAGLPPKRLERRHVRVRGWVEERGGPWIEATSPGQFEFLEAN